MNLEELTTLDKEIDDYFKNTPQDKLDKDWELLKKSTSHCSEPSVEEFLNTQSTYNNHKPKRIKKI